MLVLCSGRDALVSPECSLALARRWDLPVHLHRMPAMTCRSTTAPGWRRGSGLGGMAGFSAPTAATGRMKPAGNAGAGQPIAKMLDRGRGYR
jgi:hypothetical protein